MKKEKRNAAGETGGGIRITAIDKKIRGGSRWLT